MTRTASIFTYPWDLQDEGVDSALDNIQNVAGLNDVALAMSYHVSTYFLPHNPKRKLYYGEDGMVLFEPDLSKYGATKIRPRVSEVVDGPDFLKRQTDAIRGRGLTLTAWIVYGFNHYLSRTYPDAARQDALGNRYLSQLCVGNPGVRAYVLALTEDIMEQFAPETVHLESLSYLHFDYGFVNPKVLTPITEWCRFLMGLCMCDHCAALASRQGMDGEAFRAEVAEFLEGNLPRLPNPNDAIAPVNPDVIPLAFDGRLQQYLNARVETATSLFEEVAGLAKSSGARVYAGVPDREKTDVTGLAPERVGPLLDWVLGQPPVGQLDRTNTPHSELLVRADPASYVSQRAMESAIKDNLSGGADGIAVYNYGLVRQEHLEWLGAASHLWR